MPEKKVKRIVFGVKRRGGTPTEIVHGDLTGLRLKPTTHRYLALCDVVGEAQSIVLAGHHDKLQILLGQRPSCGIIEPEKGLEESLLIEAVGTVASKPLEELRRAKPPARHLIVQPPFTRIAKSNPDEGLMVVILDPAEKTRSISWGNPMLAKHRENHSVGFTAYWAES